MFPYRNFRNIQLDISRIAKRKPNQSGLAGDLFSQNQSQSLRKKISNLKKEARQVSNDYTDAICSARSMRRSVQKLRKQTAHKKRDFVKLYDNKLFRQQNIEKIEQAKTKKSDINKQIKSKTKQKKLFRDYQIIFRDNQQKERLSLMNTNNKTYKNKLRQNMQSNRKFLRDEDDRKVMIIKQGKSNLQQNKSKWMYNRVMSARKNYIEKVSKQVIILNKYQIFTQQFSELCPQAESKQLKNISSTFFITSNKTEN